jgi:hypothetical protein
MKRRQSTNQIGGAEDAGHEGVKKTVQEALLAALWWYARAGV